MAKGKLYRRKRNIRDILPAAVVVCEGSETEINYFKNFKKRLGLKLVVSNHGRTDVVNIIKSALKTIKRYDLELNKNDTLWAVFDCDENLQAQLNEAGTLAAGKVKLIFSNPCFEFWYLLHYENWTNSIDKNDVIRRLNNYIAEYSKAEDYFKLLKPFLADAIRRAEQIDNSYKEKNIHFLQRSVNPLTLIYVLVRFILENTKEK